jgi:hypothetical protein
MLVALLMMLLVPLLLALVLMLLPLSLLLSRPLLAPTLLLLLHQPAGCSPVPQWTPHPPQAHFAPSGAPVCSCRTAQPARHSTHSPTAASQCSADRQVYVKLAVGLAHMQVPGRGGM